MAEAVVSGSGLIHGRRVAVLASEFAFLGGSVGVATAARIVDTFDRAAAERLALVALPASGGTRMQEGTPAFVQMAVIAAAAQRYKAAGLAYLVYLRHPTTGGVLASWASLGHVTFAEPGALVGLIGPRAQRAVAGQALAPDVQTAENLCRHGVIDAVVPLERLAGALARTLAVLAPAAAPPAAAAAARLRRRRAWARRARDRDWSRRGRARPARARRVGLGLSKSERATARRP